MVPPPAPSFGANTAVRLVSLPAGQAGLRRHRAVDPAWATALPSAVPPTPRCDVVQWQDARLLPGQRWFDPSRRSSFLGRLTAGSSALNRRMRGSNPARGAHLTDEDMASMRSPTPPERVRFLPSVLYTPRSSSRPGCRSLTPVTRVRTPLGALLDATVVSGRKHTALPALRTGFESRRSLSMGLLVARMVACIHPSGVRFPGAPLLSADREPLPRFSIARIPEGVPCRGRNCRLAPSLGCRWQTHALGRAWWRGSAVSRVGRVRLPSRALTRRSSADRAPPCDGGGRRFESSRRDTRTGRRRRWSARELRRRSRRLQGSAPPQAGIRAARFRSRGTALANKPRRRAGWVGAALIWRSSVVRFHGRRSPRSSAEEQRASTPRAQVRALPGSSEVTGRRGDGPPHRLRASEIAGSNPADQILALARERRAVEERLSSRAS